MGYSVKIDSDKCIACGACVSLCPRGILEIRDGAAVSNTPEKCDGLAGCVRKCPTDAIKVTFR